MKQIEKIILKLFAPLNEDALNWHKVPSNSSDKDVLLKLAKSLGADDIGKLVQAAGSDGDGPEEIDYLSTKGGSWIGKSGDASVSVVALGNVKVGIISEPGYRVIVVNTKDKGKVDLNFLKKYQDA